MRAGAAPPILAVTLCYILGVFLAGLWSVGPLAPLPVIALVLVPLILWRRVGSPFGPRQAICVALLFVLIGLVLTELATARMDGSLLYRLAQNDRIVKVTGIVAREPRALQSGWSFELAVSEVETRGRRYAIEEYARVVVRYPRAAGPPRSDERSGAGDPARSAALLPFEAGSKVSLIAKAFLPKESKEPGSFNYRLYLYRHRIGAILAVSVEEVTVLVPQTSSLAAAINRSRTSIFNSTRRFLPPEQAGLLIGVMLGDTSGITDRLDEDFRATGLTHVLAVSGLNVGLLVAAVWLLLRALRVRPILQYLLLLAVIAFYALLTQAQPSVLRASIMASIGIGAWMLGRDTDQAAAISLAALGLLVYEPFLLYDVGFQLSFGATFALILFARELQDRMGGAVHWLSSGLSAALAAQLGVAPILATSFGQVSLISLVANVLVVPANGPALNLGIVAWLLSTISAPLGRLVYLLAGLFLAYMIAVARALAAIPGAALLLEPPSTWQILVYYVALGMGFLLFRRSKIALRVGTILILVLGLLSAATWWQVGAGAAPDGLTVTFLNVGQGDATLVTTPEGMRILIDGGPDASGIDRALARHGVGRVDIVVLSHAHADHVAGAIRVIETRAVGRVLHADDPGPSALYRGFLSLIRARRLRHRLVRRGEKYAIGARVKLLVLYPGREPVSGTDSDTNNNSLVIKISFGRFSVLLPGDVEEEAERLLLRSNAPGDVDSTILKAPHHGSSTSSDTTFLRAVSPDVAVVPVGENDFGHPAPGTLARLRRIGAKVFRTDKDGDVTITTDGRRFSVVTQS